MAFDPIPFGDRMQRAREWRKRGMRELAAIVGVSPSTLSRWEAGDRAHAYVDVVVAIAEELDVSLDWLLRGIGEMQLRSDAAAESRRQQKKG